MYSTWVLDLGTRYQVTAGIGSAGSFSRLRGFVCSFVCFEGGGKKWVWGGGVSTDHSPPVFLFLLETSSRTAVPLFRPGSVYNSSAS